MRIELHPCYVLHQRPYRETSLLLEVFSREQGRASLMAKGGRTQKNHKRALLQPGRRVDLAWLERRELGLLTLAEPGPDHALPAGRRLLSVFYINELLVKLLHRHEPHPELFDAYDNTLRGLSQDLPEQTLLRVFEKRLLEALGYGLALNADADGNRIRGEESYHYLPERGPVLRGEGASEGAKVSGRTLLALAAEDLEKGAALAEAKQLMRLVIGKLLAGRPLASRELHRFHLERG